MWDSISLGDISMLHELQLNCFKVSVSTKEKKHITGEPIKVDTSDLFQDDS
jgi:hypothetical protein